MRREVSIWVKLEKVFLTINLFFLRESFECFEVLQTFFKEELHRGKISDVIFYGNYVLLRRATFAYKSIHEYFYFSIQLFLKHLS